jgi:hypothetical protein
MSSICPSCGGIIGRDCFNPEECQWITDQMYRQNIEDYEANKHHLEVPFVPEDHQIPAIRQELASARQLILDIKRGNIYQEPADECDKWLNNNPEIK